MSKASGLSYPGLQLRFRKRIYSSLHSLANFKALGKEALSFMFHQMRGDYTNFEITSKSRFDHNHAYMLAALAL